MKKTEKKNDVQDFVNTIKDNPKKIIAWAKLEICAYNELITILEKQLKNKASKKSLPTPKSPNGMPRE